MTLLRDVQQWGESLWKQVVMGKIMTRYNEKCLHCEDNEILEQGPE